MTLTHSKLIKIGRKWLFARNPIVVTEIMTTGESPDVLGWKDGVSTLIEVKASRSDFYADKKKIFRAYADYGIGNYRYFLTAKDLISDKAMPDNWGLLETDGHRIFLRKSPIRFNKINDQHEKRILMSILRRVGQIEPSGVGISCYYNSLGDCQDTASLCLDLIDESI